MKIGIANDHAATALKFEVVKHLEEKGYEVVNFGTDTSDSCDYPDYAYKLASAVANKEVEYGIAICGTGIGISISCNKVKGIRAACVSESLSAKLTREHNNANIIAFGARIVGPETAFDIVDTFLNTPFSNGERHIKRINKITDIENKQ